MQVIKFIKVTGSKKIITLAGFKNLLRLQVLKNLLRLQVVKFMSHRLKMHVHFNMLGHVSDGGKGMSIN